MALTLRKTAEDIMLPSLRRDAYVMEANSYQEPALPEQPELLLVFGQFWAQLVSMFGSSVTAVLAIDIDPKDPTITDQRTVAVAYGGPNESPRVSIPDRPPADASAEVRLKALAGKDDPARMTWQFARNLDPSIPDLDLISDRKNTIIAPYLVRPLQDRPAMDYTDQLSELTGKLKRFMWTRPFHSSQETVRQQFGDSYYAAALVLILPKETGDWQLPWIEALHLMFQISWGFPLLGENRKQMETAQKANEDIRRANEDLQKKTKELQEQSNLLEFIRKPASELAEQIRKLEDAAGQIQKALTADHQGLFRDLERGAVFFDGSAEGVRVDGDFIVQKAHGWGDGDSREEFFIPAVLTRVLGLHGNHFFTKAGIVEQAENLLRDDFDLRPEYKETRAALRNILGVERKSRTKLGSVNKHWFTILKHVCHRPFKPTEFGFDANLCRAFFDVTIVDGPPVPCLIHPPSKPDRFLQGCRAFLEPQCRWDEAKKHFGVDDRFNMYLLYERDESAPPWLELKLAGTNSYAPIRENAERIRRLVKAASGRPAAESVTDEEEDCGAKTLLWNWATERVTGSPSQATHQGDLVGALLLILGNGSSSIELKGISDEDIVFEAKGSGFQITVTAGPHLRSIRIQNDYSLQHQA